MADKTNDNLNAARGVINGVLFSVPIWALIVWALVWWLR